jgi:hypothetical protein
MSPVYLHDQFLQVLHLYPSFRPYLFLRSRVKFISSRIKKGEGRGMSCHAKTTVSTSLQTLNVVGNVKNFFFQ